MKAIAEKTALERQASTEIPLSGIDATPIVTIVKPEDISAWIVL
jgi:hypothetical protein